MEMNENNIDSDDEWLFNSIKRYEDLLMYEFQGKVSSTVFLTDDRIVATCKNINGRYEILELAVPDRLVGASNPGLVKKRDFSVLSAGYIRTEASEIINISDGLITAEEEEINFYTIPNVEETDLISHKMLLRKISKAKICFDPKKEVLVSGSCLNNITKNSLRDEKDSTDLSVSSILVDSQALSYLGIRSDSLFIGLKDSSRLLDIDLRSNAVKAIDLNRNALKWVYNVSDSGSYFYILNSNGEIFVFDKRNYSKEIDYFNFSPQSSGSCTNYIMIQSDSSEKMFSVSGFDKTVQIFSLHQSDKSCATFIHDGHSKDICFISGHIWHPSMEQLLFSYDNIGILQAWKYKNVC